MNDFISRRAAIEYFMTNTNWLDEDGDSIDDSDEKRKLLTDYFNGVPNANARENIFGKWIFRKPPDDWWVLSLYECSKCGNLSESESKYCPDCGAYMKERE